MKTAETPGARRVPLLSLTAVVMVSGFWMVTGCGKREASRSASTSTAAAADSKMPDTARAQAAQQTEMGKRQQQMMLQSQARSNPAANPGK